MLILKNVSQNDEFNYSLIQINGKIKPFCSCSLLEVSNLTSSITIQWPITIYGYFKVFCELIIGENIIKLNCVHYCLELCLKYIFSCAFKTVEILLITCSDGNAAYLQQHNIEYEIYKNKISLAVKLVQSFIAESLFKYGYEKRSFHLKDEINIFRSNLTVEECLSKNERELWHHFAKEITQSQPYKVFNTKWIAFMTFTKYEGNDNKIPNSHEDVIRLTKGYSALGANGLALLGTGNIYSFPERLSQLANVFSNCSIVDRSILMDDSAFRGFYWSNFSTALGTILHELSHCFGMGHSKNGIMNRGGDDINIVLSFTVGEIDCKFCLPKLRKMSSIEKRDLSYLQQKKQFLYSRCKSLNHVGQCFWTESNLIMLNYHKWLTQSKGTVNCTKKAFRIYNKQVDSVNGFLLMEIRTLHPENLCVGSCSFLLEKNYHQIFSARRISHLIKLKSALRTNFNFYLVLMDIVGNIMSVNFIVNMTTLSFQFCDNTVKFID